MAKDEIAVYYIKTKDYRMIPATGAWGGISPNGEVVINFYVEQKAIPKKTTLEVTEEGKIGKEKSIGGDDYVREMQVGIVLRPDIAYSIGQFLIRHAKNAGYIEQSTVDSEKGVKVVQ